MPQKNYKGVRVKLDMRGMGMPFLNRWQIIAVVSFLVLMSGISGAILYPLNFLCLLYPPSAYFCLEVLNLWQAGIINALAFIVLLISLVKAKLAFRAFWGIVATASLIMCWWSFGFGVGFGVGTANLGIADLLMIPSFVLLVCGMVCAIRGKPKGSSIDRTGSSYDRPRHVWAGEDGGTAGDMYLDYREGYTRQQAWEREQERQQDSS
jgi:hypothetical protein